MKPIVIGCLLYAASPGHPISVAEHKHTTQVPAGPVREPYGHVRRMARAMREHARRRMRHACHTRTHTHTVAGTMTITLMHCSNKQQIGGGAIRLMPGRTRASFVTHYCA